MESTFIRILSSMWSIITRKARLDRPSNHNNNRSNNKNKFINNHSKSNMNNSSNSEPPQHSPTLIEIT